MPAPVSPFTPIPSFIGRPAQQLQQAPPQLPPLTQGLIPPPQNMGPPVPQGLLPQQLPQQAPQPTGGLPSMNPLENMDGLDFGGDNRIDPFEKLVMMMMQIPQLWLPIFAGMGLVKALEKTSKPHRSNAELSQQGYDVGQVGQTGLPDERQLVQQATQMPSMGKMPGFA